MRTISQMAAQGQGEQPEARASAPAYTPSVLLRGLLAELTRRDPKTSKVTLLRAVPQRKREDFPGVYAFILLKDPHNNTSIDGRIPKGLLPQVEWGQETMFSGVVEYNTFNDRVTVQFLVGAIEGAGGVRQATKEELLRQWEHAIKRPKPDAEAALAREMPRIAVVTAMASTAMDDIRAQLRETEQAVEFAVHNVAMNRPEDVAAAVRAVGPQADMVVVTRGGGSGVQDLDAAELIEAVANCAVPVVVAVGHASDVLVLNGVSARAFETPTAFGTWLREAIHRKRAREVEAARAGDIEAGRVLARQMETLTTENRQLRETAARVTPLEQEQQRLLARVRVLGLLAAVLVGLLALVALAYFSR